MTLLCTVCLDTQDESHTAGINPATSVYRGYSVCGEHRSAFGRESLYDRVINAVRRKNLPDPPRRARGM